MGDGRELKGQRASWEGTIEMKTGLKKWVGMHDGKESGKNMWAIKIKSKNKDWHTCEKRVGRKKILKRKEKGGVERNKPKLRK